MATKGNGELYARWGTEVAIGQRTNLNEEGKQETSVEVKGTIFDRILDWAFPPVQEAPAGG